MKGAPRWTRACRPIALAMALVANLFAAGVPVLHAFAHELAEPHHAAESRGAEVDHGHDEIHPASLHDEQLVVKRLSIDLSFLVPAGVKGIVAFTAPATLQHRPALRLVSRAPPGSDLARAPPSA